MIYHCAVTAWSCLSDHKMCASACEHSVCWAGGTGGGIYWGEVSIPHPGCEIHVGLWWFVQMEWGHRLWKPNAIWLEVNRKAIFFLPQCAEREKKKDYLLFFSKWVKVNETDWWPSLEHGVQLPNNNISVIIGISGEAGQGPRIERYQKRRAEQHPIYLIRKKVKEEEIK